MYNLDLRVRYSETDGDGNVKLHQLLNYFQDTGTFHSMSLDCGPGGTLSCDKAWYILSWDLSIERLPRIGEAISVITDPYKMKGFYGYRRFYIRDQKGETLVGADSIWVMMDIKEMRPVRIPAEITRRFVDPDTDHTVRVKRKLSEEGNWEEAFSIEISDLYLDSNRHVNNAYYVEWARSVFPPSFSFKRVRVDYRQAARKGDFLTVFYSNKEGTHKVKYINQEGSLLALLELT